MLQEITVENIAIIDQASIPLAQGFTALTGETGAGKSLLIDSIGLALGGRADSDLVRAGARKATVHLLADIRANPLALAKCAQLGVDAEEGLLIVHRELSAEGRSTVRINGKPVAVATLREIGALLVDLHGQHDHQSLLQVEKQIDFLDSWIGSEALALVAEVSERHAHLENLRRRLASLRTGQREREQRADMLRFQIEEISAAELRPNESEELETLLRRLQNAEKLRVAALAAIENLAEAEGSASERLALANRDFDALADLDPSLSDLTEPLRTAEITLRETTRELRAYAESLDEDPETLQLTADRIDLLARLKRKYGETEEAILDYLQLAQTELAELEDLSTDGSGLETQIQDAATNLQSQADQLTRLRTAKAKLFQAAVQEHVRDLAMEKAAFEVRFEKVTIQPKGQDYVEFYFTANPGEPPRPLSKVASGGELSRVMLAIKVASAGRAGVPSLIFDEVDTGLSGRAAAVTAKKLEQLAQHYQVIVISHLPQIAGRATTHFRIEKTEKAARVTTTVRLLQGEQRVDEIARMLAGERVGDSARANARELLA